MIEKEIENIVEIKMKKSFCRTDQSASSTTHATQRRAQKRIHAISLEGARQKKRTFFLKRNLLRYTINCASKTYYIRNVTRSK